MENFDEIYTELFAAIRESPGLAQETVDTLQRIIIGKEQVHVCAHCEQLFTADDTPAHMMTCEKNPVVLENKRLHLQNAALRGEATYWREKYLKAEPPAEEAHT